MAYIKYEVVNRKGGWCIATASTVGPPYYRRSEALQDAVAVGRLLAEFGDDVEVVIEGRTGDFETVDLGHPNDHRTMD